MVSNAVSTANSPAIVTLAGVSGLRHLIDSLTWSYNGVPVGRLSVADGGATVFDLDLTVGGENAVAFRNGLPSAAVGNAVVVTLAAGGLTLIGKLNVEWHDETG